MRSPEGAPLDDLVRYLARMRALGGVLASAFVVLWVVACDGGTQGPDGGGSAADASSDASSDSGLDGSADASTDSGVDAAVDASMDAGADASVDAGTDASTCTCAGASTCCDGCKPRNQNAACDDGNAGTYGEKCQASGACGGGYPCECSSGVCCDGCRFKAYATDCAPQTYEYYCDVKALTRSGTRHICTGSSTDCTGSMPGAYDDYICTGGCWVDPQDRSTYWCSPTMPW